jgi:hypothetical protein
MSGRTGNVVTMSDEQQNERVARDIAGSDYAPEAFDEPNSFREEKGADSAAGLSSTIPAGTDVDQLQDGGPQEAPGVATTTGGTAGPNSFKTRPRSGPGVANTTTGDATTGGMETPVSGGSTSDASTTAID